MPTNSLNLLNSRMGHKKMDLGKGTSLRRNEKKIYQRRMEKVGRFFFLELFPSVWGLFVRLCLFRIIETCLKQLSNCQPQ